MVVNTLDKCDIDSRKVLASNVVVAGGNTIFKGFTERLGSEIDRLLVEGHRGYSVNLVEKPYRRYISWIGASILSSLSSFQAKWITRAEYEEHGARILG